MHNQFDCRAADPSPGLPVIRGARWFDHEDAPFILQIEFPLTSEEMVAALYGVIQADEIGSDEDLCGCVAVTLLAEGLSAVKARAAKIHHDEDLGAVQSPTFLILCRRRVAALLGQ